MSALFMKYTYLTLVALGTALFASTPIAKAQDLKFLDQQNALAENQVKGVNTIEIRYSGNHAVDTIPKGMAEFDINGRITQYTEYFARGKKDAVFSYMYDSNGHLASSTVSHRKEEFKPVPFMMEFDDNGRLITRWPVHNIDGFWLKEIFTYAPNGVMVKAIQIYANGERTFQEYPETMMPKENSFSLLYDQHGLMQSRQLSDQQGKPNSVLLFFYKFD
jgi:hypothetical protein